MEAGPDSADRQRLDTLRRRRLFRDLVAFQVKLLVDALKDLFLSPVALVAALMDFLGPQPRPSMRFYQVLDFGRRLEARIDLFGVRGRGRGERPDWTVDEMLQRVESRLMDHQAMSKKGPGADDEGR